MRTLPIYINDNKDFSMMQTNWASIINPLLKNPICNGIILNNISITTGVNYINHLLGRKLQGWIIIGITDVASIVDDQANNSNSDKTLLLLSTANTTINLYVF